MLSSLIQAQPERYERAKNQLRRLLPLSGPTVASITGQLSSLHQRYLEDYVFIHIPKCGGTSVERALGIPFVNHDTALERRRKLGPSVWNRRYKFSVVRHPYDRIVSLFFYWWKLDHLDVDLINAELPAWLEETEARLARGKAHIHLQSQWWWLTDEDGRFILDDLLRLESIAGDFERVNQHLGRNLVLPHVKKNAFKIDYRNLLDDATRERIRRIHHEDFEHLGYEK